MGEVEDEVITQNGGRGVSCCCYRIELNWAQLLLQLFTFLATAHILLNALWKNLLNRVS
jgi:hypothetical protein